MDTNIFSHKMICKFVIINLFAYLWVCKFGDRTVMGRSRPNSTPKLEPILYVGLVTVAFLENATIGYSLESLCVFVCVCVCVCVFAR